MASKWKQSFGRVQANVEQRMDMVARKIALDAFGRAVRRTPVDTGRARGSWGVAVGSPQPGPEGRLDPNGGAVNAEASEAVARLTLGDTVFMVSNLVYMPVLENGSSSQSPQGMVRITVNELQPISDQAVRAARAGR